MVVEELGRVLDSLCQVHRELGCAAGEGADTQFQSAPTPLFFCHQQEVADLGVGPVQGKLPPGHSALPAFSSGAALAPGRLGNCEDFSVGQGDSRVVRRL